MVESNKLFCSVRTVWVVFYYSSLWLNLIGIIIRHRHHVFIVIIFFFFNFESFSLWSILFVCFVASLNLLIYLLAFGWVGFCEYCILSSNYVIGRRRLRPLYKSSGQTTAAFISASASASSASWDECSGIRNSKSNPPSLIPFNSVSSYCSSGRNLWLAAHSLLYLFRVVKNGSIRLLFVDLRCHHLRRVSLISSFSFSRLFLALPVKLLVWFPISDRNSHLQFSSRNELEPEVDSDPVPDRTRSGTDLFFACTAIVDWLDYLAWKWPAWKLESAWSSVAINARRVSFAEWRSSGSVRVATRRWRWQRFKFNQLQPGRK